MSSSSSSLSRLMYHSIFGAPTTNRNTDTWAVAAPPGFLDNAASEDGALCRRPGRRSSGKPRFFWAFARVRFLCLSWKIATLRCLAATEVLLADRPRPPAARSGQIREKMIPLRSLPGNQSCKSFFRVAFPQSPIPLTSSNCGVTRIESRYFHRLL